MNAMQANGNHMRAPVRRGGAGAVARGDPATIKCDSHIEEGARRLANNAGREMKTCKTITNDYQMIVVRFEVL